MSDMFTLVAPTYDEGLKIARERYGNYFYILSHRNIQKGGFLGLGGTMMVEITGVFRPPKVPAMAEPIKMTTPSSSAASKTVSFEGTSEKNIKYHFDEIKEELKKTINDALTQNPDQKQDFLVQILRDNGFPEPYIQLLVKDLRNKLSANAIQQRREVEYAALGYILKTIQLSPLREDSRARIHVLVGPTGVGKTTTIAKLAFLLGEWQNKRPTKKVALINLDDQRVEAQATLNKYGEYMRLPVHFCTGAEELERALALCHDFDHILIDTAGHSPRDLSTLLEEKKLIDTIDERHECLLTISAGTKAKDLEDIVKNYHIFNVRDVIVTKIDETSGIGNIIGVLWETNKRIRYLSCGQTVPTDFLLANSFEIMKNLVNFSENVIKEFLKELNHG